MQTLDKFFAPKSDSDSDDEIKPPKNIKNKYKSNSNLYSPFSPQWILQSDFFKPNIYTSYPTIQSTYLDKFEEYPAVLQPVDYTMNNYGHYHPIMLFNIDDSVLLQSILN